MSSESEAKRGIKRKREEDLKKKDKIVAVAAAAVVVGASDSESDSDISSSSSASSSSAPKKKNFKKASPSTDSDGSDNSDSNSDSDSDDEGKDEDGSENNEEAQVLSHAAQRKLKKKAAKAAKGGEDTASSEKTKSSKPEDPALAKRKNSVWVGNLAFKTTEQGLRGFFEKGMEYCEITRVNLPTKSGKDVGGEKGGGMRGENRGFAYVDFATKEMKDAAIKLSEQNLDGRKLLIKDGGDFAGRPAAPTGDPASANAAAQALGTGRSKTAQKILASQKQPPAPTLFIGNLGFQATAESIRGMLEGHREKALQKKGKGKGKESEDTDEKTEVDDEEKAPEKKWIRQIRVGTFEDSGKCKGWAFIDFFNIEDATGVLIDPRNHNLDGRKLVVEYASADAVRRGGGGPRPPKEGKEPYKKSERKERNEAEGVTAEAKDEEPPAKKSKFADGKEEERKGGKPRRTKPGAALALAKRESVAIVPSTGKKIKF